MRTLIYISFIILLGSCASYNRCAEKFGTLAKDTVYVDYNQTVHTQVTVPADSSSAVFGMDTITPGTIYTNPYDSSSILIHYWIDKYTRLFNIKAKQPDKLVPVTIEVHDTVPCPPAIILADEKGKVRQFFHTYCVFAGIFLPIGMIILVALWLKRRI